MVNNEEDTLVNIVNSEQTDTCHGYNVPRVREFGWDSNIQNPHAVEELYQIEAWKVFLDQKKMQTDDGDTNWQT